MNPDKTKITTETYRLTPAVYFRITAGAMLPAVLGSAAIAVIAAFTVALFFDLRLIFVALILLFLIIPMFVGHIYYSRLLTTDAMYALTPKHVTIIPDHTITETFESADKANTPPQPRQWAWSEIHSIGTTGKHLTIRFNSQPYMLILPLSAVEDKNALLSLTDIFR